MLYVNQRTAYAPMERESGYSHTRQEMDFTRNFKRKFEIQYPEFRIQVE